MTSLALACKLNAVNSPRSKVAKMIAALRRLGGNMWMVDNAFSGAFVDNVGTQPVTAYGNLLGLGTDRLGVLGPNLSPNGTFDSATGWTVGAWAIGSGVATATATSSSLKQQGTPLAALKTYQVEFDANIVSGTLVVRVGDGSPARFTAVGSSRRRAVLVAANANGVEFYGGAVTGSVDNVVVQELTGSQATQSAVASKPSVQSVNGRTVISFADNDFLQTGVMTGNEGFVAAGVTPSDVTASRSVACSGAGNTTAKGVYLYAESGNWIFQVGNGSARQEPGRTAAAINQPAVVSAGWNASTISLDVDTTSLSAARSGDCVGIAPMTLGSYITGTLPFSGSMHAIAYAPVLPNAATRATIRNGIAALQGRTL